MDDIFVDIDGGGHIRDVILLAVLLLHYIDSWLFVDSKFDDLLWFRS